MNPKGKHKFAIIGTSCAGKTTLAYGLVSRLKSYGVLADGVFSQDRKFSFDKSLLGSEELAQQWMVNNLIAKETDAILQSDVKVLVSDRSVLDLFAYYSLQYPDSAACVAMYNYVVSYLETYDKLYYLNPLPYQDDNKRPTDEFRLAVDLELARLLGQIELTSSLANKVVRADRHKILEDVMLTIGVTKPSVKKTLTKEDMQFLSNKLGATLATTTRTFLKVDPDVLSDTDIFCPSIEVASKVKEASLLYFGSWVKVDTLLYSEHSLQASDLTIFTPQAP